MIRVLIAEDEPPTMRRIKRMIEQVDADFSVVATAVDGEEALQKMESSPCDILFTDIRMPIMDGLQLMDAVRERYADCQIVIISGYQDFTYVTHAVRASAVDYLLKPVSMEALSELAGRLKKTHARLKKERLTKQLSATINRTEVVRQGEGEAEQADARFCVCLFCAGSVPLGDDDGLFFENADFERISLEDVLHAVVPGYDGFTWAFVGNTQVERILIFERARESIVNAAFRLYEQLQAQSGAPISCACAADSVALADIGKTIGRLRRALLANVSIGKGVFIEMQLMGGEAERPKLYNDHHVAKALSGLLQGGRFSTDGVFWRDLLARMQQEEWTQDRIHSLLISAFAYLEAEKGATEELMQARSLAKDVLSTAMSYDDLSAGLVSLKSLFSIEEEEDADLQNSVAARVEQYLIEHYAEHINNQTLGMEFGYVPSYISLLFRKAYDMSPAEYLMKLRLDMAKRLMREKPKIFIRDIAEQVGFKSPHHFSRIFKKYEGVWPTGYSSDGR